jgi:DnaJ-class molecular chaperone
MPEAKGAGRTIVGGASLDLSQGAFVATETSQENYYRLLNVAPTATTAEITRAYRVAIKRAHPDKALPEFRVAQEEITKDLNRAYSTLADPVKRRAYDRTITSSQIQEQIMNRYVGGLGTPASDPFATNLKRSMSPREERDRRRSDRSAMYSVLSSFLVLLIGGIGLLILFAIGTYLVSLL